ncbi:alpha/beta fold hydrolase [Mycolicibacterium septicum]|uniref:alpha/beta fold hydrolase n=1 Tax=Mycolicibacterium septicum TaxID=98668 RepID=UPI001AF0B2AC|nr:alpha/beta hydrolase [Mycolicibacterium septicum]QRY50369.1 alpha/beta hydrolase [Mycolicibacterium septicum]
MRRLVKAILLCVLATVVVAIGSGAAWEQIERNRAAAEFPAPGKMIDIGGRAVHLDCRGHGSPTVVLESGADTSGSALWFPVHQQVASFTRVCSYDRAGLMWSEPAGAGPRDPVAVVDDLQRTLRTANESSPYVMVGASLGGPLTMIFTKYHGSEVAGLVFVDAAHPDQTGRLAAATGHPEDDIPAVFKVLRYLAWTGLPRLLIPEPTVPELPADVVAAIGAYQPVSLAASFDEADAMEATLREAGTYRDLGDRPLAVLSRGKPWSAYSESERAGTGMTRDQFDRMQQAWWEMQVEEASWSTQSTHRKLDDSSHVIQLERPDAVVDAIRAVVSQVRARNTAPTR